MSRQKGRSKSQLRAWFAALGLTAAGCIGSIADGADGPAGGPAEPEDRRTSTAGRPTAGTAGPAAAVAPGAEAGPLSWRRLTAEEYSHTVRDLLRDPGLQLAAMFPPNQDQPADGFLQPVAISDESQVQDYADIAEAVARGATLGKLLPCTAPVAAGAEDACAHDFIAKFGRRAYRRHLDALELANLKDLFATVRKPPHALTFDRAVRVLLASMLQSAPLTYRGEPGPARGARAGEVVALTGDEVAVRLSYFLWASMPDDQLFAAADAGQLRTPGEISAQARRMLADPRARDGVVGFTDQLLRLWAARELDKDPSFRSFNPAVRAAMVLETQQFVASVVLQGDARIETLMTAPFTFVNAVLAKFYGMTGVAGDAFARAPLPKHRAGLLTQGAFLMINADGKETSPTKRGAVVLEHFLTCTHIPTPDEAGIDDVPPLPARTAGMTRRQQVVAHAGGTCAGCHRQTDPIGFAFENFNAVGEFVTTDNGAPVDPSGQIRIDDREVTFANAVDLVGAIGGSGQFRACFARKWLRYALTRSEGAADEPTARALVAELDRTRDVRGLLVTLAQSRSFTHRQVMPGEVLP